MLIEGNAIFENNLPNPFAPGDDDDIALIPTGTGILNVGGDGVVIRRNLITGNDTVGVAILANPFAEDDPRIEPIPDNGVVRGNAILNNGTNPDPERPERLRPTSSTTRPARRSASRTMYSRPISRPESRRCSRCFGDIHRRSQPSAKPE